MSDRPFKPPRANSTVRALLGEIRAVKRNLVGLVMLGLGAALLACRAGETPSIATPSAQPVAVTATVSTAAATDTPTPPPSATATTAVVPTATPTRR